MSSEERLPLQSTHMQAVLFDCDGVLVDTEPLGRTLLLEHLRTSFGDSSSTLENELCWIWPLGAPLGPSLARAQTLLKEKHAIAPDAYLSQVSWPMDLEHSIRSQMEEHLANRSYAISGMPELFARLHQANTCSIGVCSNGPITKMRQSLRKDDFPALNWSHVFSGHAINCFKPDPGLLHYAARSLGIDVRNILLIDDSDAGVTAAAAAGMLVCAFGQQAETSPAPPQEGSTRLKANYKARNARELLALLHNLGLLTGQS